MTFEAEGFEELANELESFADELAEIRRGIPEAMDAAVKDSSEELAREMKSNLQQMGAVDSGELLRSISIREEESAAVGSMASYSVGPTADHAKYVEYGTGLHGPKGSKYAITPKATTEQEVRRIRSLVKEANADRDEDEGKVIPQEAKDAPALQFTSGGDRVTTDMVMHPGSEKKPFFRNAVRTHDAKAHLANELDEKTNALFKGKMV